MFTSGFSNVSSFGTLLVGLVVAGYFIYRQTATRTISRRDLLLPAAGVIYLAYELGDFSLDHAFYVVAAVIAGVALGAATGAALRIWRDPATGFVYQQGDWRAILVLVAVVALRFAARAAIGDHLSANLLTFLSLAMGIGVLLGRTGSVLLRALALVGGNWHALPARRKDARPS